MRPIPLPGWKSPANSLPALVRPRVSWRLYRRSIRRPATISSSTLSPSPRAEIEQAVAHGGRRAIAVAKRKDLDAEIVGALAATGRHPCSDRIGGKRVGAPRERCPASTCIRRARRLAEDEGDRRLADAVLQREQTWPESASLFLCARPSQRVEILLAAQRSRLGRSPPLQFRQTRRRLRNSSWRRSHDSRSGFWRSLRRPLIANRNLPAKSWTTRRANRWLSPSPLWAPPTKSWCAF